MLHRVFAAFAVAIVAICATPQAFAKKVGPEFQVTAGGSQPKVAAFNDGRFVVVWESNKEANGTFGIFGQRFGAGGNKVGRELHINSFRAFDQSEPSVARLSDGRFVVVWTSAQQDDASTGVYGQRFSN